ncbi:L7Ae/L30e/S12e/Gadd45 family ribosomal protein [Lacticigenium naphthae]|uniref:L7Ae/L30e/S12e/Gadd45 family ribosomal protein n=1 Tax=Lacticigenium naphthae TaxID=515351 RepID=UPI0004846ECA|nr:ribosomal L7Ae/L30e/S12e/Gadd45 family protein [Lacticigenium naphthae]
MSPELKVLNLLGLAMKAGKLTTGESLVLKSVQSNQAKIVLVAEDASENTKKKFTDKCSYYSVPIFVKFTKFEMSNAIGRQRTICSIADSGFGDRIKELLK